MQLLGLILLIPVVLVASTFRNLNNAKLTIDEKTQILKKVTPIVRTNNYGLSIVNLTLKGIDSEAFSKNWRYLRRLSLNNNLLQNLPQKVLNDLPQLEYLGLPNNLINSGHFYGESSPSLRTLSFLNNPLATFTPGYFYGLKDTTIYLEETPIKYISTGAFENYTSDFQDVAEENPNENSAKSTRHREISCEDSAESYTGSTFEAQYCIKGQTLLSIEAHNQGDALSPGCQKTSIVRGIINLVGLKITDFSSQWYGISGYNISAIILDRTEMSELTKSFVDDLPHDIRISIANIKLALKQLRPNNTFHDNDKYRFSALNFSDNFLTEIPKRALMNFDITGSLYLSRNKLTNTVFLDTLPNNVSCVIVSNNNINEISVGNFEGFPRFRKLDLSHNRITVLESNRLRSLLSLRNLDLSHNNIDRIEPGFFIGLQDLEVIHLNDNNIFGLDNDIFVRLNKISIINLARNHLMVVAPGPFSNLPDSLLELNLQENNIATVKTGSFKNGPNVKLHLNNNKISKIENGSFKISHLMFLDLSANLLNKFDSSMLQGIQSLDILSLKSNMISEIRPGMDKHLNTLFTLDLSDNPITLLTKSALSGLSKENRARVILMGVPLKSIHSELFDKS